MINGFEQLASYFSWLSELAAARWLFRGQSKQWPLIPSVYREGAKGINNQDSLNRWKSAAGPYLMNQRPQTETEWLVVAQHHSVPTSLLDWTTSPLVALYFACRDHVDQDGEVMCLDTRELPEYDSSTTYVDPFGSGDHPCVIVPARSLHARAMVQQSLVTLQRGSNREWAQTLGQLTTHRYQVAGDHKAALRGALRTLGVDEQSLMSDLPTVAKAFAESPD